MRQSRPPGQPDGPRPGSGRATVRGVKWRPTLGLLVVLSAIILVEGLVTMSLMVLKSRPPTSGCTRDLLDRTDRWCQLERAASLTGTLPTTTQVTDALGAQKLTWMLGSGNQERIVNEGTFTIFAVCRGEGQLVVKVYDGGDALAGGGPALYDLDFGCDGHIPPGFHAPARYDSLGRLIRGPYVIVAAAIGHVTAAEYFVQ